MEVVTPPPEEVPLIELFAFSQFHGGSEVLGKAVQFRFLGGLGHFLEEFFPESDNMTVHSHFFPFLCRKDFESIIVKTRF